MSDTVTNTIEVDDITELDVFEKLANEEFEFHMYDFQTGVLLYNKDYFGGKSYRVKIVVKKIESISNHEPLFLLRNLDNIEFFSLTYIDVKGNSVTYKESFE